MILEAPALLLAAVLIAAATVEMYYIGLSVYAAMSSFCISIISSIQAAIKVVRDYRSGVYYKPFGRKEPVIVRSAAAMQELSEAPELSQRAIYADIFGFKYTMSHTDLHYDPNTVNSQRYRLFTRAIKIKGLAQIRTLHPYLESRLERTLREVVGPDATGHDWKPIQLSPVMRDFATGMLGIYFFGGNLCNEPDFSWAMSQYYNDVVACMGALQVVPRFMQSLTHSIITKKGKALNVLFNRLLLAIDTTKGNWNEKQELKEVTLLYNMVESTKDVNYWTHASIIQALIGIWFAASHQPWINLHFVVLELCARPEYCDLIRKEVDSMKALDYESIAEMPILDSFIKESVRLNPLDKMSIRRKALKPYTFVNGGYQVALGEIACAPAWELMHNEAKYPNANSFDGLRFVKQAENVTKSGTQDETMTGTTFTDASKDFPIWGLGSKVCPGRWHASLVMKMAIVHLVANYDFRLEDKNVRHKWFWETFQMPYESSRILLRKREGKVIGER